MNLANKQEQTLANELQKIDQAYDSPAWWYDIRGFFILSLAYQSTLFQQIRFFNANIKKNHLEAAVGTGTLFHLILKWRDLMENPRVSITAFDYAERMLDGAKKKFGHRPDIRLLRADIGKMEFQSDSFDSVNIANSFHCFPDVKIALKEVWRVLKPQGTLAVNVLLFPKGKGFFSKLATKINNWGMKKGILHTPYESETVATLLKELGYEILEQETHGNSCNFLVRKPSSR